MTQITALELFNAVLYCHWILQIEVSRRIRAVYKASRVDDVARAYVVSCLQSPKGGRRSACSCGGAMLLSMQRRLSFFST